MEKAGDILKRFLKEKKLIIGESATSLCTVWDRIAGEPLSHHTRVADIRGRKLIVDVEHPGWYQTLLFHRSEILARLRREYPSLKFNELRVRYRPMDQPEEKSVPVEEKTTGAEEKSGDPSFYSIEDENLKKTLESLYKGIVRKRSQDRKDDAG